MNTQTMQIQLQLTRPGGFTLDIDLNLPAPGITVLFGPSGSGKTTALRCVAGLEKADQARIEIDGVVWQDTQRKLFLPTWQRPLGYVFQEASLFDHLDVNDNLRFGLRRAAGHGNASEVWLDAAIELLGIGTLLTRRPHQLSGGERQRVAIARALATQPRLLLLDEPLAALDGARRQDILPWLERLRDELKIPMLYVTHSADEMARLADTLVLMEQGHALACGPTSEVLLRTDLASLPADETGVLLQGQVRVRDTAWQMMQVGFEGGRLWLGDTGAALGQPVRIRVLARDVSVATEQPRGTSVQNLLPCTILQISPDPRQSGQVLVRLACDENLASDSDHQILLARITARAADQLSLRPGLRVWAQVKAAGLVG